MLTPNEIFPNKLLEAIRLSLDASEQSASGELLLYHRRKIWNLTEPREEQAKDILQKIAESVREVFGDSHEQECRSRKRRH
jgi:hypothetical protein